MMILTALLGFVLIGIFTIISDINHTTESGEIFYGFVNKKLEEVVKNEVENRIDEIEYDLSILYDDEYKTIKNKIAIISQYLLSDDILKIVDL